MHGDELIRLADAAPWFLAGLLAFAIVLMGSAMHRPLEEEVKDKTAVVIDDDPLVRRGLKSLIEARTPFKVVAEARTGTEGINAVETHGPDLVIVDVVLPGMDGIGVARSIRALDPELPIVSFSSPDDDPTGAIMRRAGASAHLVKGDDPDQIIRTVMDFA